MNDPRSSLAGCEATDLSRRLGSLAVLWGIPIAIILATSLAESTGRIDLRWSGALWTAATAWIGLGCLVNARRCGRTHCIVLAATLVPLSVYGAFGESGILTVDWTPGGLYWRLFLLAVALAFLAECFWRRYAAVPSGLIQIRTAPE